MQVQEVSQRIERWQCEKPVVFREISIAPERKNSLESFSGNFLFLGIKIDVED